MTLVTPVGLGPIVLKGGRLTEAGRLLSRNHGVTSFEVEEEAAVAGDAKRGEDIFRKHPVARPA